MAKKRVPLHQNPRGFVDVDPDATNGAQVGVNLRGPDGQLLTAAQVINPTTGGSGGPATIASTIWKLIKEVPLNIQKLAVLIGAGFAVRKNDGDWALRVLQEGTGIDIANPDGEAGNPTIGLEDVANTGAGTLQAITRDGKGRATGSRPATITGTAQQINVANGNAAAGLPTLSLASEVLVSLGKADSALQPGAPHNTSLSGLQGGSSGERYHANAAQNASLAAISVSAHIDGLQMVYGSGTSISFTSGTAAIQSSGLILRFPSTITKSGLSLTGNTWYHCYGYSNAGTPDVEIVTTVPAAAYFGAARSKTGDTSRRYLGSIRTLASGQVAQFQHNPTTNRITYLGAPYVLTNVLAAGTATAYTTVSCANMAPVTALDVDLLITNVATSGAVETTNSTAVDPSAAFGYANPANGVWITGHPIDSSQAFMYRFSSAPNGSVYIDAKVYSFAR